MGVEGLGYRCGRTARTEGLVLEREQFSHELRTPLAVVKGSVAHVLKHWDRLSDAEKERWLCVALDQIEDLAHVISFYEELIPEAAAIRLDDPEAARASADDRA